MPEALAAPGPEWAAGYGDLAKNTSLDTELYELEAALHAAGECLNPRLSGEVVTGTWDPASRRWT